MLLILVELVVVHANAFPTQSLSPPSLHHRQLLSEYPTPKNSISNAIKNSIMYCFIRHTNRQTPPEELEIELWRSNFLQCVFHLHTYLHYRNYDREELNIYNYQKYDVPNCIIDFLEVNIHSISGMTFLSLSLSLSLSLEIFSKDA
jgi:hypothetical protein